MSKKIIASVIGLLVVVITAFGVCNAVALARVAVAPLSSPVSCVVHSVAKALSAQMSKKELDNLISSLKETKEICKNAVENK